MLTVSLPVLFTLSISFTVGLFLYLLFYISLYISYTASTIFFIVYLRTCVFKINRVNDSDNDVDDDDDKVK